MKKLARVLLNRAASSKRRAFSVGQSVVVLVLVAGLFLWSAAGARADTVQSVVDQQNVFDLSGPNTGFAIANNYSVAQTFTVGIEGTLAGVDVAVFKGSATTANLTLSIWSTSASGTPLNQLASSSLPATAIPTLGLPAAVSFDAFSQPVEVVPGTVLGIRLDSPALNNPPFNMRYDWMYQTPGSYAGGRSFVYGSRTTLNQAATDFYFRTYVVPIPEPGTLSLVGVGLVGLLAVIRRKRG